MFTKIVFKDQPHSELLLEFAAVVHTEGAPELVQPVEQGVLVDVQLGSGPG